MLATERLQQGLHPFIGQSLLEARHTLRSDNRDALWLAGETEEFNCADRHTHVEDNPGNGLLGLAFAVGEHQSAGVSDSRWRADKSCVRLFAGLKTEALPVRSLTFQYLHHYTYW
ncbi:MAG: hypothetical protein WDN23_05890 [Edaphobacter sp.]